MTPLHQFSKSRHNLFYSGIGRILNHTYEQSRRKLSSSYVFPFSSTLNDFSLQFKIINIFSLHEQNRIKRSNTIEKNQRCFHSKNICQRGFKNHKNFIHTSSNPKNEEKAVGEETTETITLHWDYYGDIITVEAEIGKSLLEIAHENKIELEGACGGELACSTCHVIFSEEIYDILPEKEEEEEDMLDLAWGLTDTSRLGCQIKVTKALDGCTVTIPDDTNNMSF